LVAIVHGKSGKLDGCANLGAHPSNYLIKGRIVAEMHGPLCRFLFAGA
jgi:hypothetical protein